ncbi:MAG: GNAT family N-acetyltransferase [Clostridia bacterium]|nr:GNAT family N-acetyltransferase [Clostridia bacterium]
MSNVEIRIANTDDAEDILKIYEYYVKNTAITFEYDVPAEDEFKERMANTLKKYPYFVAVLYGKIIGYAYAGPFVGRAAYDWSAEMTIYIAKDEKKHGIGRKLCETLESNLSKMGVINLYACIGYPEIEDEYLTRNSAEFHEHMGFTKVGEFHKCGYKFQRWYNMIWMEKIIGKHESEQKAIRCFSEIEY